MKLGNRLCSSFFHCLPLWWCRAGFWFLVEKGRLKVFEEITEAERIAGKVAVARKENAT